MKQLIKIATREETYEGKVETYGSWLPKAGMKYPGAISFWKQKG